MANLLRDQSALYKLTAISIAGLLVGVGLCGTGSWIGNENIMGGFVAVGASVFWLSALGLLVSIVWAVVKGLIEGGRPRPK